MLGHRGWCATLDDWFDPNRVRDDYVPTGFKPYSAKTFQFESGSGDLRDTPTR